MKVGLTSITMGHLRVSKKLLGVAIFFTIQTVDGLKTTLTKLDALHAEISKRLSFMIYMKFACLKMFV